MIPLPLRRIADEIVGLFMPDLCLLCEEAISGSGKYVCSRCWASLPVFPDRSGLPFRSLRGVLDRLWIGWDYDWRLRRIVHLFKYDRRPELAPVLVEEWWRALPQPQCLGEADLILPVPIHSARRRWRGFNQSERLAVQLASRLHIPVDSENSLRIINTPSQTLLGCEERWRNVARAFRISNPAAFEGRCILIVDDLCTSGATLHALANLLRDCGTALVSAAVLTSPAGMDATRSLFAQ